MTPTPPPLASQVSLRALAKSYGDRPAVVDVSLELSPGSFTALLGPSGCGKSTTLEIVAGILAPDQGRIEIDGVTMGDIPAERRPVSLVFQKPLLFPHLSVGHNVAFGLRMRGESRDAITTKVDAMLDRVRLPGFGPRRVHELSGGQEQRVALARALVLEPKVLLLDEPFSQLDVALRVEMRQLVRDLTGGITTVFVTHDQAEAVDIADQIALMLDGRIESSGTPEQMYLSPATLATARFLGVTNEIGGRVDAGVFTSVDGAIRVAGVAGEGPGVLTIRPEAIAVDRSMDDGIGASVAAVRFAGSHLSAIVAVSPDHNLAVRAPIGTKIETGDDVAVHIAADRCTFFGGAR